MTRSVALVTGGAGAIGLACARALARDGFAVALLDRDPDRTAAARDALVAEGVDALAVSADVGDEADVARVVDEVVAWGRVDVLVTAAGTGAPAVPLWETDLATFTAMLQVHLIGTFLCARAIVPGMRERGYGRIVAVSSVAGKEGNAGAGAYSAAKAGVLGLVKSLGKELATDGVLVNAVTPTIIDTPLVAAADPEQVAALTAKIPMGRVGVPEEVAEMVAWLASPRCSFSTAAVFDVSGGRTTY